MKRFLIGLVAALLLTTAATSVADEPVSPSKTSLTLEEPAPLAQPGDRGRLVREIQARLKQIGWYDGKVTGRYGKPTTKAVKGFQAKRGIESTGEVDQKTYRVLRKRTHKPTSAELHNRRPDPADGRPLDARCKQGRVLCIDKTSASLRWVIDGRVRLSLDARFGGDGYFTREGQFSIYRKSRDHVSSLYDTAMPFAMLFSGGQAVHYSPDFAKYGYSKSSHGCVNIRDYNAIAGLFDEVAIGTKVIIYRS